MKIMDPEVQRRLEIAFPTINKNDDLADYEEQTQRRRRPARVERIVELTGAEYEELIHSLLTGREWLAGLGGVDDDLTIAVVEVRSPGRKTFFIDPQGYDYARYVGFENGRRIK